MSNYYRQQRKQNPAAQATPGFACQITDDTDLGLAFLVAEFADGKYEPVSACCSISEGREIAASARRFAGHSVVFRIWAHGIEGKMVPAASWIVGKNINTLGRSRN